MSAENKNKAIVSEIIIPTVVLFIIAGAVTLILAAGNYFTKDIIAEAEKAAENEAMKTVMESAEDFEEADGYYIALKGDEKIGYVFVTSSKGYGGDVSVMTGIDSEGKISGISILSENETAGLGKKANDEAFTNLFKGKTAGLSVTKSESAKDNEIKAITGATITSNAVTDAVSKAFDKYEEVAGNE